MEKIAFILGKDKQFIKIEIHIQGPKYLCSIRKISFYSYESIFFESFPF